MHSAVLFQEASPSKGLVKYYSQVLEATKLPVYLYHYPGMSEVPITPELAA